MGRKHMKSSDKEHQVIPEKQKTINKRRRNIAKAGVATPLIMSLMNKTALGQGVYHCSISGAQSGNTSSPHDTTTPCNVGYSVTTWQTGADQSGVNGGIDDWLAAGVVPFAIQKSGANKQIFRNGNWENNTVVYDKILASGLNSTGVDTASATAFNDVFTAGPTSSFWDVLAGGGFDADAAAVYLNAAINNVDSRFNPVYDTITPADIINLYLLNAGVISSFTTSSGVTIHDTFNVANYFAMIKN